MLIEKHREYYLVLDEETGAIFLVNETSHFCMKIVMDKVSKVCVNCFLINALIRISWTKDCIRGMYKSFGDTLKDGTFDNKIKRRWKYDAC